MNVPTRNIAVETAMASEIGGAKPKFAIRNLSVLAYAQGFTLWHYRAGKEPLNRVAERGYFNDAADMFNSGDMVLVSGADGGRVLFVAGTQGGITTASLA
jgi:hypothetical protein